MRIRTMVSTVLAVAALAIGGTLTSTTAGAIGPDRLPLTVTNQSGRAEATYLYVIGVNLANGRLGYVDAAGTFQAWPAGSLPPSPAPDVSIPGPGNGGSATLQLPRGFSGRVYFSFGQRIPFSLTPDGLVQPAPWAAGDPSRDILLDWSELTYNDAGLWLNSSQVDMFAVPHAVTVTGASGVTKRTGDVVADGRNRIIDAMRADAAWSRSVVTRSDGTVLRVLSPGKAAGAGLLSPTYLDGYIASAWSAYASKTLTVVPFTDQPGTRYFGRTSGDVMTFTNAAGQQVASFTRPSSADVWGCDGRLHAPNDLVVGPIARTLCAALFRGTLGTIDTQPSTDASQFYRSSPNNLYGKVVHQNMVDGKAYAFAFDDVGAFESLVHDGDPRSAGIVLSPFSGSTPPPTGTTTRIVSDWHGKCVDVPSWNFADGQRLIVWTCHDGTNQRWSMTGGTLRTENDMCMDVAWGSTVSGAAVQLARCSGNAAQQWVLTAAGDLVNPQADKCLDIADWNPADGAVLQLWECSGGANQKWHRG